MNNCPEGVNIYSDEKGDLSIKFKDLMAKDVWKKSTSEEIEDIKWRLMKDYVDNFTELCSWEKINFPFDRF